MSRFGVMAAALAACAWTVRAGERIDFSKHPINQWVQLSPRKSAPIPAWQWEGSGDYDPAGDRWIHHGGHDGGPQGFATFTMDLTTARWRQRLCNTYPPGVCCVDGSNVFDVAHGVFVRFPGAALGHGWQWSRGVKMKGAHAWLFDPAADRWVNMRPPPYAEPAKYSREILGSLDSSGTYDPVHELAISFGGQTSGGDTNVLHVYDAYSNGLHRMDAAGRPSRRDGCGIAYDAAHDCLVMFGSQYGNDERTWIYRYGTNRWEGHDLKPRPPGRKDKKTYSTIPRLVYDSVNQVMVCVVWLDRGGHETWVLDVGKMKWTKMNPAAEPAASRSRTRNMAFSARHNLVILDAEHAASRRPRIWTYRYKAAAPRPEPPAPTGLTVETAATSARLAWRPGPGAQSYNVHRAAPAEPWKATFKKIAGVAEPRFEDKDLQRGAAYRYRVAAVGKDGREGPLSFMARTQPRVVIEPVVSVPGKREVQVSWRRHPAGDVAGYNVYRGLAKVQTVTEGKAGAWRDNDPKYDRPMVVAVRDITGIRKLNDVPIKDTSYTDGSVELSDPGAESAGYRFKVHAYVVRAVNALGTESGPSPYALTLPSAPQHVLCRQTDAGAELKWAANPEKHIAGYHVYRMSAAASRPKRLTDKPVKATRFSDATKRRSRYFVVAVDALGQEGEPSAPVWFGHSYAGFHEGDWHP
jgi:fibronectin type 3 domain-containing protein